MAVRLQEVHPSLVHFPIALLPLTLAADTAGSLTGNRQLSWFGRWGMVATAASALVAGLAGLIAQEEVNVSGPSMDTLITHRNLNLGVVVLTAALAGRRLAEESATPGYLAAAAGALAALTYSGYLGGKIVYQYGVGVESAPGPRGGLWQGGGPELKPGNAPRVARTAARDLGMGVKHLVQEVGSGKIAPSLFRVGSGGNGGSSGAGQSASSGASTGSPSDGPAA